MNGITLKSFPQQDFSERKWEGTLTKKILDKIENQNDSEFLRIMRNSINELQSKSVQKVELRKPDFEREGL